MTRIETSESAQQVLDKVDIWLKIMNEHEDKYNIEKLHPHYDAEIRDYEGKLNELSIKLTRAKRINNFVEYSEIMDDGYKLLRELFGSHAMKHFKDDVTQNYFSSKTNKVSQTPLKSELVNFETVYFNLHISIKMFLIHPY